MAAFARRCVGNQVRRAELPSRRHAPDGAQPFSQARNVTPSLLVSVSPPGEHSAIQSRFSPHRLGAALYPLLPPRPQRLNRQSCFPHGTGRNPQFQRRPRVSLGGPYRPRERSGVASVGLRLSSSPAVHHHSAARSSSIAIRSAIRTVRWNRRGSRFRRCSTTWMSRRRRGAGGAACWGSRPACRGSTGVCTAQANSASLAPFDPHG
jgi:hypothetical protein